MQADSALTSETAGVLTDVTKKLWLRILSLEQQLRSAGIEPFIPENARVTHIGDIKVRQASKSSDPSLLLGNWDKKPFHTKT